MGASSINLSSIAKILPQKIEYLLALGQICKESGKFSDTIKYLYNALKINPNNDLVENLLIDLGSLK